MSDYRESQADERSAAYGASLRKNFSWSLAGNVVYAGCQWGILIALAKLTGPEIVGRFALGLAISAPIIMLSWLQLRSLQATDVRYEYSFGQYLGLRLITTIMALMVISAVACFSPYSLKTALVILAVGFSKAIESISDIYYGVMQRYSRMDVMAKSKMIKGPLSLLFFAVIVYLTDDVLWGVVGLSATWLLILLTFDLRNATVIMRTSLAENDGEYYAVNIMRPAFNMRSISLLVRKVLPLGIGSFLVSLQSSIPNIFLENHWGEGNLGIFASLAYIIFAGNTIVIALGQSALPKLAAYYANANIKKYKHLLYRILGIGLFLALCGILFALVAGRPFLSLVYQPQYADYNQIFVLVMVAGGMSYLASFLNIGLTSTRNFKSYVQLFLTVAMANFISSLLLIPHFGLTGAALALIIGSLTQIVGTWIIINARCKPIQ